MTRQLRFATQGSAVGRTRAPNDAANAPMLAVNAALGYRPFAVAWGAHRAPSASS